MSNLTIWWLETKIERPCQRYPKVLLIASSCDAYRPIYTHSISIYIYFTLWCQVSNILIDKILYSLKMGQKFQSWTELVFYTQIHNVNYCIKRISQWDDVLDASFCSLSNLVPFLPLPSLASQPTQFACFENYSINSYKIHLWKKCF